MIGYAYGDALAEQRFSQFNVAEVGALSRDLPFMTKELVKRIKMDKRVNITEDWKVSLKYIIYYFFLTKKFKQRFVPTVSNNDDEFKYVLLRTMLRRLYYVCRKT